MKILDPTGTSAPRAATTLSPRLADLSGKRVVALWNGRQPSPGRAILSGILGRLDEKYGLADSRVVKKPYLGNEAPPELVAEIVASADAVITGVGD